MTWSSAAGKAMETPLIPGKAGLLAASSLGERSGPTLFHKKRSRKNPADRAWRQRTVDNSARRAAMIEL
jgi:hypothetical protein